MNKLSIIHMFFLPIGFLIFILFLLALPLIFFLGYFHILSFGFGKIGFSSETAFLILLAILIGSVINIPLGKRKLFIQEQKTFFGVFGGSRRFQERGVAINLGGAIIPILISLYFLTRVPFWPAIGALVLMIFITNHLAKIIPDRGIKLSAFIPPIFAAFFAFILNPEFVAPTAFVAGTLGTLIGADLLKLRELQEKSPGFLSIGGAGVFDGIFLIGIISVFLSAIF